MAPEVWSQKKYSEKADMFSLGIVMWELWYGKDVSTKYTEPTYAQDLPRFRSNPFIPDLDEPPEIWQKIMKSCWKSDPNSRPNALECIKKMAPFVCE